MERMDQYFSVFNLHVNRAGKKADLEFVKQFGQENFDSHIKPFHEKGIMSIFQVDPTPLTMAWVALVTLFANAKRTPTTKIRRASKAKTAKAK